LKPQSDEEGSEETMIEEPSNMDLGGSELQPEGREIKESARGYWATKSSEED
jgi:hypothetical protein